MVLHVDLDFSIVDGDFDVLVFAVNLDKIGVGIFLEFFGDDLNERQRVVGAVDRFLEFIVGDKVQRRGNGRGGHPEVNVRAAGAGFVNANFYGGFPGRVDGGGNESSGGAESEVWGNNF